MSCGRIRKINRLNREGVHSNHSFPDRFLMEKFLIIGYGNPLCGDDGVAWRVVAMLQGLLPDEAATAVHQLTPELAESVSYMDCVVFVDAAETGLPGEVRFFPIAPDSARPGSHEMTPGGLLGMAHGLYGRCPSAYMVTITGYSFDLSEALSEPVAAAVPEAVRQIMLLVEKI